MTKVIKKDIRKNFKKGSVDFIDLMGDVDNILSQISGATNGSLFLDVVEWIPILGDCVGGIRIGLRAKNIKKLIDALEKKLKKKKKKKKDKDDKYFKKCKGTYKTKSGKTLNIPKCGKTTGDWSNRKKPGDSNWKPKFGTPLFIALAKYGKTVIKFRKGYPVFDPFAYSKPGPKAIVNIGSFNKPVDRKNDMDRARDKYRQKLKAAGVLNSANWPWPPKNSKGNAPAGWTWHHHQNGRTMILIPQAIHGITRHCGGIHCN